MTFQIRDPSSKMFLRARVRRPTLADAERVAVLARTFPHSELDASCLHLFLSGQFATSSIVAEMEGYVVGFAAGYRNPSRHDTLSVWQVGTVPPVQGKGIATAMLLGLLAYPENTDVCFVEISALPDDRAIRRLFARTAQMMHAQLDEVRAMAPRLFTAARGRSLLRVGPIPSRNS